MQAPHKSSTKFRCDGVSARAPRSPTPSRIDRRERAPTPAYALDSRHALSASIPLVSAVPLRPGPTHRRARDDRSIAIASPARSKMESFFQKTATHDKATIAEMLRNIKPGDIRECDGCEGLCLREDMARHVGSMHKECFLCPECDLPLMWSSKWSKSRRRRYYVFFDPQQPKSQILRWSHPTPGNPAHVKSDRGLCTPRGISKK